MVQRVQEETGWNAGKFSNGPIELVMQRFAAGKGKILEQIRISYSLLGVKSSLHSRGSLENDCVIGPTIIWASL